MTFIIFHDACIDSIHHVEATKFAERLAQVVLHVIDQLVRRLCRCDSALRCSFGFDQGPLGLAFLDVGHGSQHDEEDQQHQ
jgi:hypothetical protein